MSQDIPRPPMAGSTGPGSEGGVAAEALAEGLAAAARVERGRLLALAEGVAAARSVVVDQPPAPSTVLLELDSAVGNFCLAEAVVTTAVVTVDGKRAWGCALGYDELGALASAVCQAGDPTEAARLAGEARAVESERAAADAAAVTATRVSLS